MWFLPALIQAFAAWLLRPAVLSFVGGTIIYGLLTLLLPYIISYISPFLSTNGLTSAFTAQGSGVWYFLDFFDIGFGLPLMISAWVARFLVRRLPIVG